MQKNAEKQQVAIDLRIERQDAIGSLQHVDDMLQQARTKRFTEAREALFEVPFLLLDNPSHEREAVAVDTRARQPKDQVAG